jgi:hypothetical protein
MNDDDAPDALGHAQKVALYMETLRARMDPEQYEPLAQRLHDAFHLLAQGREGTISSDDDSVFTPEMNREFTVVLNILLTGKMDQRVVEISQDNGDSVFVLMDPEDADDPTKVQEVKDFVNQRRSDRERMDAELGGIATCPPTPTDQERDHPRGCGEQRLSCAFLVFRRFRHVFGDVRLTPAKLWCLTTKRGAARIVCSRTARKRGLTCGNVHTLTGTPRGLSVGLAASLAAPLLTGGLAGELAAAGLAGAACAAAGG